MKLSLAKAVPNPPVVSAAFSGFVVGIVVTLVLSGVVAGRSGPPAVTSTLPPSTPVADSLLLRQVARITNRELGPYYPAGAIARLVNVTLIPANPMVKAPDSPERLSKLHSIVITFRLNDHPLGPGWRMRAAKGDVLAVLKALYTSSLPVYNVEMDGTFTFSKKSSQRDRNVLIVYMDHSTASSIPWDRWGPQDENRLWAKLPYHYVDPRFARSP